MPLTTTMSSDLPPTYFGHYKLSLCWSVVLQCKTQQQPVRPFTSSYVQCNLPQWWCYFIMQVLILQPLLLLLICFPHATGIATIRILCLTHTILCSQLCHMHFTWCTWHNGCSKCAMCAHAHGDNYDCLYQWSKKKKHDYDYMKIHYFQDATATIWLKSATWLPFLKEIAVHIFLSPCHPSEAGEAWWCVLCGGWLLITSWPFFKRRWGLLFVYVCEIMWTIIGSWCSCD